MIFYSSRRHGVNTFSLVNIAFTSNKNIMRQFAIGWFWRMFYILLVVVVIITNIIFIIMKSDCFVKLVGAIIFLLCYLLFCGYLMIDMVLQMDAYPRFNSFLAQSCLGSMFHQNDQQYLLPDDNNHSVEDWIDSALQYLITSFIVKIYSKCIWFHICFKNQCVDVKLYQKQCSM